MDARVCTEGVGVHWLYSYRLELFDSHRVSNAYSTGIVSGRTQSTQLGSWDGLCDASYFAANVHIRHKQKRVRVRRTSVSSAYWRRSPAGPVSGSNNHSDVDVGDYRQLVM